MKKVNLYIFLAVLSCLSACSIGENGYLFGGPIFSPRFDNSGQVIVQKGDTLYSLSQKHEIPLRDIIEKNNLRAPYILAIGQGLKIPGKRYHLVEKGDTLYNISKRYNVNVSSLSRHNSLREPYLISIGDKLLLPGSLGISNEAIPTSPTRMEARSKAPVARSTKTVQKRISYQASREVVTPRNRNAKLAWPVRGKTVLLYGATGKGKKNDGINISAPLEAKVGAADSGTVVYAGNELKGFGNLVLIKHSGNLVTAYAHNHKLYVKKGQKVSKGQQISSVGKTGGVTSPQLHFEVHINKKPVNPLSYLP